MTIVFFYYCKFTYGNYKCFPGVLDAMPEGCNVGVVKMTAADGGEVTV